MIEIIHIKIFLIIMLILFTLGFIIPLILIKKGGKDPHGVHDGFSKLSKLTAVSIFTWLFLILLYILFYEIIGNIWAFTLLFNDLFFLIGMVIITLGFLFDLLGTLKLGFNFRIELPKEETELITSGIYRLMRNPIVFGIFLLVIGTFLIIPNFLILITLIFNIITFNAKARDEEKFLSTRFGKVYEEYKNNVGRYFPLRIRRNHEIKKM